MKRGEGYLRAVRRGLADAPAEDRERLMKRLTEAVSAFLEENPEAVEADLIRAFGTPESCAAELLEECDPAQVAAVRRKRRLWLYALIAVLAAVVLAALALLLRRWSGGNLPVNVGDAHLFGHSGHGAGHH